MGREIRKVPAEWEHPKDERGEYKPLFDQPYREALDEWIANDALWREGKHPDQIEDPSRTVSCPNFADWDGNAPDVEYYRPAWTEPADHYQVYETVTEGTPTSPVFATEEEIVAWLMGQGYGEDSARGFVARGWAPSGVGFRGPSGTVFMDGIAAAGVNYTSPL